ncbi:transcription factor Adf-1-like [Ornithodoros turicata]|uniref:transcription factor Adf-1-like n=1 Tax=Ornithodoros turicata TaxID=34597 RepID=UPI003138BD92
MAENMEQLENFILQIERYPWLYDSTRADYKDATKKQNSWQAISLVVGMSVDQCQRTWRNLRDRYARELRATKQPSGSGRSTREAWALMKPLSLLSRFIRPRSVLPKATGALLPNTREDTTPISETTAMDGDPQAMLLSLIGGTQEETLSQSTPSPVTEGSSDGSSASAFTPTQEFQSLQDHEDRGETPPVGYARPPKRRRPEQTIATLQEVLVSATRQMSGASAPSQDYVDMRDSDTLFLLSLRPMLAKMDDRQKHLAQLRIQQLLFDMTYGN